MNVHLTKHLAFCINITNINCMSWFEMNMAWIFTVRLLWFNTWLSNAGDCSLMPQAKKKVFFAPCLYVYICICMSVCLRCQCLLFAMPLILLAYFISIRYVRWAVSICFTGVHFEKKKGNTCKFYAFGWFSYLYVVGKSFKPDITSI